VPIDRIFIDLDGVTADFDAGLATLASHSEIELTPKQFKKLPGAYRNLPLVPGAAEAIKQLITLFGVEKIYFLSKPPKCNHEAWADKSEWVQKHFPQLHDNLILTRDKATCGTKDSVLIDDRPWKGNVVNFPGTVLHFGPIGDYPTWVEVLELLTARLVVNCQGCA
jgi:5'(3')-deoxyribonucleotidase